MRSLCWMSHVVEDCELISLCNDKNLLFTAIFGFTISRKKRDQNIWLIRMYGISEFSLSLAIVFMVSRGVSHEMFSFPLKIHVRQDAIVAMHRVTCLPSYKCSSIFRNIARILRKVLFLFGRENERKRESEWKRHRLGKINLSPIWFSFSHKTLCGRLNGERRKSVEIII